MVKGEFPLVQQINSVLFVKTKALAVRKWSLYPLSDPPPLTLSSNPSGALDNEYRRKGRKGRVRAQMTLLISENEVLW